MRDGLLSRSLLIAMLATSASAQTIEDEKWLLPVRTFSVPLESMLPTMKPGDGAIGERVAPTGLKRGEIVVFRGRPGQIFTMRLVGLPGDTVEMRAGTVILNGTVVSQRTIGPGPQLKWAGNMVTSRLIEERLPGAASAHRIVDFHSGVGDDAAGIRVPDGHFYVLGDNRDNAADSRFDKRIGVGLIAFDDVYGRIVDIMPGAFPVRRVPQAERQPATIVAPSKSEVSD